MRWQIGCVRGLQDWVPNGSLIPVDGMPLRERDMMLQQMLAGHAYSIIYVILITSPSVSDSRHIMAE